MRLLERRLLNRKGQPASDKQPAMMAHSGVGLIEDSETNTKTATKDENERSTCSSPSPVSSEASEVPSEIPLTKTGDERLKTRRRSSSDAKLKRKLSGLNSLAAIKLKMCLFVLASLLVPLAEAGFFTFYFPNIFKPKGYDELTQMIDSLDDQINSTRDQFSDAQYFWGQLQRFDAKSQIENNYPEQSACSEIMPAFRDLAIEYVHIDFEFYIKPFESYREYLIDFRKEWYPKKTESKSALPREWEQKLLQTELQLKIEHLERLTNEQDYRDRRQKLVDIWRNVRRSLDDSLQCIYLRYAYRQIAEDINQIALEANLDSMKAAMNILVQAYDRIAKFKSSDEKIIKEIEDELRENERFTIRE